MSNKNKKNVAPVAIVEEVAVVASAPAVEIEASVEAVQESIAAAAVTSETAVVVEKKPKNKPNETTRTIESFKDDTKGIRAGSVVSFTEAKNAGKEGKTIQGIVQRLFDFYAKPERQEAKIMVTNADGKTKTRFYRFEKDLTVVVAETAPAAEVAEVAEA